MVLFGALVAATVPARAQDNSYGLGNRGESWALSFGGRLYDMWWPSLGVHPPDGSHPAYPSSGPERGWVTWRCVSCHGWDYRGVTFKAKDGKSEVKIKGLREAEGRDVAEIVAVIRGPGHRYTEAMIPDSALEKLALFVSKGQHDVNELFDPDGAARGVAERATGVYADVCANCHGPQGTAFIYAEEGDEPTLGWVSRHKPYQVLHKIRNGQPGADMLALRFLNLAEVVDLIAYLQTLTEKAPE